ncbi:class IV adenylate cyclase [Actinoplanes oblitus]|uniref:Class IV adenylate cyclase n=1 Tax=Actinoplanes oblitus TaxID=3040509 RepID=A0ABY8WFT3_9ACTN|nr:class IV adenylate cyclase [Actinoplanes oblitus]WIM95735.1 class IV adenylate cyclase [Actinoplanes oblitus]
MSGEIEVKYRVLDRDGLLKALAAEEIILSPGSYQDDQAYAPTGWQPGQPRIGVTFVRLRTQDGQCTFTTKTPVDNVLACQEHETVVADREAMHHAIMAMGYRPTVRVAKSRRTARVGAYSLCLDEVDGVGTFMEVEAVSAHVEGMAEVQAELSAWVDSLGVDVERTGATYDQLVQSASVRA